MLLLAFPFIGSWLFCSVVQVSTELTPLSVVDLMAVDEESFELWTKALEKVVK
jgi:hypothetical protein